MSGPEYTHDQQYLLRNLVSDWRADYRRRPVKPGGWWSYIAEILVNRGTLRRVGRYDSISGGAYEPAWSGDLALPECTCNLCKQGAPMLATIL